MITGLGNDIALIDLFTAECARARSPFLSEHFTPAEREACAAGSTPRAHSFAGRYAAKEACIKALGSVLMGQRFPISYREMEILPGPHGAPTLTLSGKLLEVARNLGVDHIWVSISHDGAYAFATVILEKEGRK